MKKDLISLVIFFALTGFWVASSAQTLSLQGKVIDEATGEAIAYASVALCGEAVGTITNEEGKFVLYISESYEKDSLCLSYLGYASQRKAILDFKIGVETTVSLKPDVYRLEEILITNTKIPPVKKIVEKAFKRIPKNHPAQPYLMEGYYRDYLQDSSGYHNLLEAAIGIYDRGFQFQDLHSRIKIYQVRHRYGLPMNYSELYENNLGGRSGHINVVGGNDLSVMMYNNPLRNYNRQSDIKTGYEFDENFIKSHHLTLESVSYPNDQIVYCIRLEASEYHLHLRSLRFDHNLVENFKIVGHLYIRAEDYAILRLDYQVLDTEGSKEKILNQLRIEYQAYQGAMYLNYLSFANFIRIRRDSGSEEYLHFRELFINQLRTQNLPSPDSFYLFSRIQQIFDQSSLTNERFWEEYNMVLRKEEQ